MSEMFMVNLKPDDADDVAKMIIERAAEARALRPDAEVLLRLTANPITQRFSCTATVIHPDIRVIVYKTEED